MCKTSALCQMPGMEREGRKSPALTLLEKLQEHMAARECNTC